MTRGASLLELGVAQPAGVAQRNVFAPGVAPVRRLGRSARRARSFAGRTLSSAGLPVFLHDVCQWRLEWRGEGVRFGRRPERLIWRHLKAVVPQTCPPQRNFRRFEVISQDAALGRANFQKNAWMETSWRGGSRRRSLSRPLRNPDAHDCVNNGQYLRCFDLRIDLWPNWMRKVDAANGS